MIYIHSKAEKADVMKCLCKLLVIKVLNCNSSPLCCLVYYLPAKMSKYIQFYHPLYSTGHHILPTISLTMSAVVGNSISTKIHSHLMIKHNLNTNKKYSYLIISNFCFIDYAKAFDCVYHNKLWKILKEMGIPDHLTCNLRNL